MDVVKNHGREVLLAIGTRIGSDTAFYVFAMFPLSLICMVTSFLLGLFALFRGKKLEKTAE